MAPERANQVSEVKFAILQVVARIEYARDQLTKTRLSGARPRQRQRQGVCEVEEPSQQRDELDLADGGERRLASERPHADRDPPRQVRAVLWLV